MTRHDYIHEVTTLTAPAALRQRIAALPEGGNAKHCPRARRLNWMGLTAALVLVAGLGLIAPSIYGALRVGGDINPPPIVTESPAPVGIIAEGIDVSPTVLDAAKEYVQERLVWASEHSGATEFIDGEWREKDLGPLPEFDNWRIEGLSAVYDRKELGEFTVDVYRLDYRFHTTTPERVVLAGGMELDDEGWLLPTYPNSTYLVFILNYSSSHYFATIINDCSPGSELFDATIMGDIDAYVAPLTEEPTPTPTPQVLGGTPVDALDYGKLEEQMDAGDWADLQEYLPVLREGAAFRETWKSGTTGERMGPEDLTLAGFYRKYFSFDPPGETLILDRFTLCDLDNNGAKELILYFAKGGGYYLILHREGREIYGTELTHRAFEMLQRDGVYVGSGGAGFQLYLRATFRDGWLEEELLGHENWGAYEIDGTPVSAEYFWTWRQNLMVGDMDWYYPAQPTGRKPPPSTEDERRYHVSIQALPLEEPFDELPGGLLATLEDTGEIGKLEPGSPFIMKTYRSPALVVQTLMVSPEMLEELLAEGTFTQEQYDAALGTEYIYTARPLDSSYPTGSGLRLGDSVERARELFYSLHDDGKTVFNAVLASLIVTTENGVVTGLFSSSGGRTVGELVY